MASRRFNCWKQRICIPTLLRFQYSTFIILKRYEHLLLTLLARSNVLLSTYVVMKREYAANLISVALPGSNGRLLSRDSSLYKVSVSSDMRFIKMVSLISMAEVAALSTCSLSAK